MQQEVVYSIEEAEKLSRTKRILGVVLIAACLLVAAVVFARPAHGLFHSLRAPPGHMPKAANLSAGLSYQGSRPLSSSSALCSLIATLQPQLDICENVSSASEPAAKPAQPSHLLAPVSYGAWKGRENVERIRECLVKDVRYKPYDDTFFNAIKQMDYVSAENVLLSGHYVLFAALFDHLKDTSKSSEKFQMHFYTGSFDHGMSAPQDTAALQRQMDALLGAKSFSINKELELLHKELPQYATAQEYCQDHADRIVNVVMIIIARGIARMLKNPDGLEDFACALPIEDIKMFRDVYKEFRENDYNMDAYDALFQGLMHKLMLDDGGPFIEPLAVPLFASGAFVHVHLLNTNTLQEANLEAVLSHAIYDFFKMIALPDEDEECSSYIEEGVYNYGPFPDVYLLYQGDSFAAMVPRRVTE
ncbi:hypothetical protein PAPHI01_1128 [Pancytospora philotis]|nr:hypothetical protein PAPHI01_1128 [Pancytospora philotis]